MNLHEYLQAVVFAKNDHPGWRMGQAYYNVLHEMSPEIARRLLGGNYMPDPFYNDKLIPAFLAWLADQEGEGFDN